MRVRPAVPDDAGRVLEIHVAAIRAFGPAAYDGVQVEAWADTDDPDYPIEDEAHRFVVAERDGEVAGFGDLHADDAEVRAVYVHPDHARRGVGSAILSRLEDGARERGTSELGLDASLNAVGFYERAGYERLGETIYETGGVELDVVRMGKRL